MNTLRGMLMMLLASCSNAEVPYDGQGKVPTNYNRHAWECVANTCWHEWAPKWPMPVWINWSRTIYSGMLIEGVWHTIDLSQYLPPYTDARFLNFTGMLLISYGRVDEVCTINVAVRKPGTTTTHPTFRVTARQRGERSNFAGGVPLVGNTFELKWMRSWSGSYPEHCSVGINVNAVSVTLDQE